MEPRNEPSRRDRSSAPDERPVADEARRASEPAPVIPAPAAARAPEAEGSRGTVFLVDDDEALRRALNRLLVSCGFRVHSFASAEEFLARHQPEDTGCLLVDLRMPGRSGLDLQEELERTGATLPIVFLTGHADRRTRQIALEHGAVAFLQKPAREQELLAALDLALS